MGIKLKISVNTSFEIISTLRQFIRILSISILKMVLRIDIHNFATMLINRYLILIPQRCTILFSFIQKSKVNKIAKKRKMISPDIRTNGIPKERMLNGRAINCPKVIIANT